MAEYEDTYEKVIELARRRGFVWPSSEIYGSVAGFIDYGPLGAMLKRRIEATWRRFYVVQEGYYEIECPTVGIEPIYVASGHVGGFSDKMFQCPHCQEFLRADHVAEAFGIPHAGTMSKEELHNVLVDKECPACNKVLGEVEVFDFNLMFTTSIGPGGQRKGYLRPETAQGMFVDFARLLRFYRDHLPFGAVQIGKSYRNEISPRQGMIRLREFTQAEAEIFVHPEEKDHPNFSRYADYKMPLWGIAQQETEAPAVIKSMREAVDEGIIANEYVAYYVAMTHDILCTVGFNPDKIRFRQHMPDERAHYATDCWDAEALSDRFGWVEIVGIADRTDYDIGAHSKHSGQKLEYFDQETGEHYIPYVIEPSLGADRVALAFLVDAYDEEVVNEAKKDTRVVLHLHPALAPYKCAVLPLSKKLNDKAQEIQTRLSGKFNVDYDDTGSIGKRYRRQDEIGTPFCVTYDFQSEEDGCVTVRNRDTMKQDRISIDKLEDYLTSRIDF